MTLTSFIFTELANTMKYGEGCYITLFSPSDVTAFYRITKLKARASTIFRNCENLMMGTPEKLGDKSSFQSKYFLNFTMMASLLLYIIVG